MNRTLQESLTAVRQHISDLSGTLFEAEDIALWYKMRGNDCYLFTFFDKMVADKLAEQKIGIAKAYQATIRSLRAFCGTIEIRFSDIDFRFLSRYEHFLLSGGATRNTVAYYMRNLRSAYNRAKDEKVFIATEPAPFNRFKLSVAKTIKRALPADSIRTLALSDLSSKPQLAYARDLFMASFYLRGMPFVDLIHLRRENVQNGHIVYSRRKTGVLVVVRIVPQLQTIIDRYKTNSDYLFPCLSDCNTTAQQQYEMYRRGLFYYNRHLKRLGIYLQLDVPLTGYVARHTWATQAKNKGASTTVISEGLGHASEKITQIYLKSFDDCVLDNLNSAVSELR